MEEAMKSLHAAEGVVLEGMRDLQFNCVYRAVGHHDGWPRYASGSAEQHLVYDGARKAWTVAHGAPGGQVHATFPAEAGGLLVGENEWSCLIPGGKSVSDWEPRALTISLLESEELIPEHEARVAADNEEEKLTRAAAAGDAAAITHVKRRRTKRLWKKAKVIRHVATFGSFAEECAAEDRGAVYAQARFRGYRARHRVMLDELGIHHLYMAAGTRCIHVLQMARVLRAAPKERDDVSLQLLARVVTQMEEGVAEGRRFFTAKTPAMRERLLRHARAVTFKAAHFLWEQGDASNDRFYFVVSGKVAVVVDGVRKVQMSAGSTFGEKALLQETDIGERTAGILAISDCLFITLTRADYFRMIGDLERQAMLVLKLHPDDRTDSQVELVKSLFSPTQFFHDLHHDTLQMAIARSCRYVRVRKNELLFRQGDDAETFYLIVRGFVRVVINGKVVVNLGPGMSFGEMGVMGATPAERRRTATIIGGQVPGVLTREEVNPDPVDQPAGGERAKTRATDFCDLAVLSREDYQRYTSSSDEAVRQVLELAPGARSEEQMQMLLGLFKDTRFFKNLSSSLTEMKVCRNLGLESHPGGHPLFEAGDVGETFYLIVRGTVVGTVPGRQRRFELTCGDMFGDVSVTGKTEAERKRTATIVCKDDCLFATLSRAAYLKVMDNLEEQAYAALRKEPERRTKSDLSLLCSFFAELAFFKELHFPLLQAAVCEQMSLQAMDAEDVLFEQDEWSKGVFYVLLRGRMKVELDGEDVQRYASVQTFGTSDYALSTDADKGDDIHRLQCDRRVVALPPRGDERVNTTIWVTGFPRNWEVKHLFEAFKTFGKIDTVRIMTKSSARSSGAIDAADSLADFETYARWCTITFSRIESAKKAAREKLIVKLDPETQLPIDHHSDNVLDTAARTPLGVHDAEFDVDMHRDTAVVRENKMDLNKEQVVVESVYVAAADTERDVVVALLARDDFISSCHDVLQEILDILASRPRGRTLKQLHLLREFFEHTSLFQENNHSVMIQRNMCRFIGLEQVAPGEELYREGDRGDKRFIIVRGVVNLGKKGEAGTIQKGSPGTSTLAHIHVRGIGVEGWDGTEDGVGMYENEEALQEVFTPFGVFLKATIRHRIQDGQNTSWAVVTMGDASSVDRALSKPVVVGNTVLVLNRFSPERAASSTGGMVKVREDSKRGLNIKTAGQTVGDEATMDHRTPYAHTAVAKGPLLAAAINRSDFLRICQTDLMQEVIDQFWELGLQHSAPPEPGETPVMDFDGYKQLYFRIGKVITTKEMFSQSELRSSLHEDWKNDLHEFGTKGQETLNHNQYSDALFQLIDEWCGGVESTELYAELLKLMLNYSTNTGEDGLTLKPQKSVPCKFQELSDLRHEFSKKVVQEQRASKVGTGDRQGSDAFRRAFIKTEMFNTKDSIASASPKVGRKEVNKDDEQEKYFRDMFNSIDKDGSGTLDRDEVAKLSISMGRELRGHELDAAMAEMDPSGDGAVDFDEFKVWFKSMLAGDDMVRELFESADKDGSGVIDREELRQIMLELGNPLSPDQLDKAMAEMDQDGSGEVDFTEFSRWFSKLQSSQSVKAAGGADPQASYYKDMFDKADTGGEGSLDREELKQLMKELGRDMADHELDTAMQLMDEDGGGTVDFDEFQKWFGWLTDSDMTVRKMFDAVDSDGSGTLDHEEVQQALRSLCKVDGGEEMTEEQMQEAIKLMDVDGSGEVDFDEFSNWWSVYQFQQRHRPDDPVIAHYRTVFDQMAKELAEAGTSDPDAKQAKVMAVMQGQGVINKAAFLKLCAALGRPLYAHETEAAVTKVTASTKNITFEIFMMFFDDLQASDGALLMMFEAVDVDRLGIVTRLDLHKVLRAFKERETRRATMLGATNRSGRQSLIFSSEASSERSALMRNAGQIVAAGLSQSDIQSDSSFERRKEMAASVTISEKELGEVFTDMQTYRREAYAVRRAAQSGLASQLLAEPPRKGEVDFDSFRWWATSQMEKDPALRESRRIAASDARKRQRTREFLQAMVGSEAADGDGNRPTHPLLVEPGSDGWNGDETNDINLPLSRGPATAPASFQNGVRSPALHARRNRRRTQRPGRQDRSPRTGRRSPRPAIEAMLAHRRPLTPAGSSAAWPPTLPSRFSPWCVGKPHARTSEQNRLDSTRPSTAGATYAGWPFASSEVSPYADMPMSAPAPSVGVSASADEEMAAASMASLDRFYKGRGARSTRPDAGDVWAGGSAARSEERAAEGPRDTKWDRPGNSRLRTPFSRPLSPLRAERARRGSAPQQPAGWWDRLAAEEPSLLDAMPPWLDSTRGRTSAWSGSGLGTRLNALHFAAQQPQGQEEEAL